MNGHWLRREASTLTDEGLYELRFGGVVKGNTLDGLASQPFNVTKTLAILGVSCS